MNFYYYLIHCNSIGDNIASFKKHYLAHKLAQEKQRKIIALVHTCTTEEVEEYVVKQGIALKSFACNTKLLDLYKEANLFQEYTFVEGINDRVYFKPHHKKTIQEVIFSFYGNKYTKEIDFIEDYPDFWNICHSLKKEDIVDFYKNQYVFLKNNSLANYNVIQYCSHHYDDMATDEFGKCVKRLSFEVVRSWIEKRKEKTFNFIGSQHDFNLTQSMINKLNNLYPSYRFINLCGDLNLKQCFSIIYNADFLLSTESFSGFLGGVFNIPSTLYFRYTNVEIMNMFIPQFEVLDSLKIISDSILREVD